MAKKSYNRWRDWAHRNRRGNPDAVQRDCAGCRKPFVPRYEADVSCARCRKKVRGKPARKPRDRGRPTTKGAVRTPELTAGELRDVVQRNCELDGRMRPAARPTKETAKPGRTKPERRSRGDRATPASKHTRKTDGSLVLDVAVRGDKISVAWPYVDAPARVRVDLVDAEGKRVRRVSCEASVRQVVIGKTADQERPVSIALRVTRGGTEVAHGSHRLDSAPRAPR